MDSAVTMAVLAGAFLFSVATAVLIEEVIFGGLSRVVLTRMNRSSTK
jgi:hypothetical protein